MTGRGGRVEGRRGVGVVVVNFGEPVEATPAAVELFLERIFLLNAGVEPDQDAVARAKTLARRRAPRLLAEYESIGGSPLNTQANAQAKALEVELGSRRLEARVYSAFQFTPPSVRDRLEEARRDGVETLVALPVYPLCGQSTTVAALESVERALREMIWSPTYVGLGGWHHHREYACLRADSIRAFIATHALNLNAPDTLLYFSAHGTPVTYLRAGSRYDRYVREHCEAVAELLGVSRFVVGFQNHHNRRVEWTRPDNDDLLREVPEGKLVIEPISFMHEQSETLAELDGEMRETCAGLGKQYWRVPIPHDSPRFIHMLGDLVEGVVTRDTTGLALGPCSCVACPNTVCTNAGRYLPPSPYVPATEPA